MTIYYLDTSALLKSYLSEPGSEWMRALTAPDAGNIILVSDLIAVEFSSALARRIRERSLTSTNAVVLQTRFFADLEHEYLSIALTDVVLLRASEKVHYYPLRSLDAIQLASALEARHILDEPITFVSADKTLLAAAASEEFAPENPNDHIDFQPE